MDRHYTYTQIHTKALENLTNNRQHLTEYLLLQHKISYNNIAAHHRGMLGSCTILSLQSSTSPSSASSMHQKVLVKRAKRH